MISRQAAVFGVGGALLVAYLAAANMPSDNPPSTDRAPRATGTTGAESIAADVRSQAARLQARMAQAPTPHANPRNPFSFGLSPRAARTRGREVMVHAADVAETAPMPPPLPALTLMGIAEETTPAGPRRTAVIGGDGDAIFMVIEGEPVGSRYRVTKIGADAVELEDVVTHGYRRIAMR